MLWQKDGSQRQHMQQHIWRAFMHQEQHSFCIL